MSDTATLVRALRVLARDIHCEDGIAVQCITEAADAIERLRLTDEEREAIEIAIGRELDAEWYGGPEPGRVVALRGLLERTK
jgi:hypothetical protein